MKNIETMPRITPPWFMVHPEMGTLLFWAIFAEVAWLCSVEVTTMSPLSNMAGAHLVRLRKVYSGFNTVFLSLLLLAAGVGFPAACFWR